MRERPILFSGPMVRAIIEGRKTQTRRVIKKAIGPSLSVGIADDAPGIAELSWLYGDGPGHEVHERIERVACPYGAPGDRLWVRETWNWQNTAIGSARDEDGPFVYAADGVTYPTIDGKWRPSIHMPRYACRLTLEVTDVRVESLQSISHDDAREEGIFNNATFYGKHNRYHGLVGDGFLSPIEAFEHLWESINGTESWEANPWVWIVEFKRIEQ